MHVAAATDSDEDPKYNDNKKQGDGSNHPAILVARRAVFNSETSRMLRWFQIVLVEPISLAQRQRQFFASLTESSWVKGIP
jgi:hypothetical protein